MNTESTDPAAVASPIGKSVVGKRAEVTYAPGMRTRERARILTRLLNNRVEQYNTKRSYWGEDERQPRTDGINTGLDLPDALPPVINKTIANARYAVKLDGYTSGILKNRIDKANVNMVLVDKENKLSQEQKLTLILWARKIDISQVAKNILQGGMVDGEGLIKPVQRWDKSIGKYIKPVFLEIGAHGYGLKKEFNDDNEVQLYLLSAGADCIASSLLREGK